MSWAKKMPVEKVKQDLEAIRAGKPGAALWDEAPTEFTDRNTMMEISGDSGTGRTTLALSAPGPIALIHTAEKIKGIIEPFAKIKKIKTHHFGGTFRGSNQIIAQQAMDVWKRMEEAWYDAFNWARTIVLDTHTEAWELVRVAHFGDLKPSGGRVDANYGPVNARWRSLFKHYRESSGVNVILIGQTKDEYKTNKKGISSGVSERTGKTIRAGQKEILYFVDCAVRTCKEDGDFYSVVEKGWMNAEIEGDRFIGKDANFATIMGAITDTPKKEWTA